MTEQATSPDGMRGRTRLGPLLYAVAGLIAVLAFISDTIGLPFDMPRTWYSHRTLWYGLGGLAFLGGVAASATVTPERNWTPKRPGRRFDRVVLYTKPGCHLCDQALDALMPYRRWLPEIEVVDISGDASLDEKHGGAIPVVEIDGTERFRGHVDEFALRRLIEGTPSK